MAAGDPLAQFHPVSLHPPASLHPAASCVTSPVTLNHPRLCRGHPFCTGNAPTLAEALPPPFRRRKRGRRKDCSFPFQTFIFFRRTFFCASSTSILAFVFIFSPLKIARECSKKRYRADRCTRLERTNFFAPPVSYPPTSFKKKHSPVSRNHPLLYTPQGNCIFTAAFYCRRIKRIMSSPACNLPYLNIFFGVISSRMYICQTIFTNITPKFYIDIVHNTLLAVLYSIKRSIKGLSWICVSILL